MTHGPAHPRPIRIGILAAEPLRVAGLASIFDLPAQPGHAQLVPVIGTVEELIASAQIEYVVVDMHSAQGNLELLGAVRNARPQIRLIVIGPEDNDELVMNSIVAGARAYLGRSSGTNAVRKAIEVVTSGSIWAPRHLLSRLIDRLLELPRPDPATPKPSLTPREEQVLKLIMNAQSTREIARQLGIETRTVKAYVAKLMHKAGVDNRVKLSTSALSLLVSGEESAKRGSSGISRRKFTN
ncbi:MAG: response regulator transcription factor [Terracidiphilus sp.]